MLIERQVSIALGAMGAAVVLPQALGMVNGTVPHAGVSLGIFTFLGAIGVFLGMAVVAGWENRVLRLAGLVVWTAVGLGFAGASVVAVLHAAGWVGRIVFALVAIPPVAGPVWVFIRLMQG